MRHILDLERWPLDELGGAKGEALVAHCRKELRMQASSISTRSSDQTPSRPRSPTWHRSSTPPRYPLPGSQHLL